jgi:hypothetical protein
VLDALRAPGGDRGVIIGRGLAAAQRVADGPGAGDAIGERAPAGVDAEGLQDRHDAAQLVDGSGRERRRRDELHGEGLQRSRELA